MLIGRGAVLDDHERQGLGPAMDYVQRIKTRFIDGPDTYKQFLEILASHRSTPNNVGFYSFTLPHANAPLKG
jgi:histone deacetylase complex regulatory component SIN3